MLGARTHSEALQLCALRTEQVEQNGIGGSDEREPKRPNHGEWAHALAPYWYSEQAAEAEALPLAASSKLYVICAEQMHALLCRALIHAMSKM